MNPADKAQVEQAKFNAREAKRQAGLLMGDVTTNALRFNEAAEQKLASGVAVLGKTGGLSFEKSDLPSSGIGVGPTEGPEVQNIRQRLDKARKELADAPEFVTDPGSGEQIANDTTKLQSTVTELEGQLTSLTQASNLPEITGPDSLVYATGSDLLTLTSLRDKMERDKRSLIRKGQSDAYTMILSGKNYEKQAGYASDAATYNTWATILGGGLKLAGTAASFGLFGA